MARVPYGYIRDGETLVIDADQAAVIVRIFDEFTRPYVRAGLSEIADGLNVDETPNQRGGKWHALTVRFVFLRSLMNSIHL